MDKLFKYTPADFGILPVKVLHMDLHFAVFDDHTDVKSALKVKSLKQLEQLELAAVPDGEREVARQAPACVRGAACRHEQ